MNEASVPPRRVFRSRATISKGTKKIFSRPSEAAVHAIRRKHASVRAKAEERSKMIHQKQTRKLEIRPFLTPKKHPVCVTTFGPEQSNIGTRTKLNIWQCLRFLDPSLGTPTKLIDVYLEILCSHANSRLSKITGADHHSPDTDPLFYSVPCGLIRNRESQNSQNGKAGRQLVLTRRQFWKLRYLFLPMMFQLGLLGSSREYHVTLCVISPGNKSVCIQRVNLTGVCGTC